MLALFWETAWGVGASDCVAVNRIRMLYSENMILKRKVSALQNQIAILEAERESNAIAANSPMFLIR